MYLPPFRQLIQTLVSIPQFVRMEPTSDPAPEQAPFVISGSCACGMVIYKSTTLPLSITLCHCTPCRKASGAPFLSFGLFHNTALQWSSPDYQKDPPIKIISSPIKIHGSSIAVRGSCGSCGSPLFMKYHCRPDGTSIVMGIVDDENVAGIMVKPKEHIFLKEKAFWWNIQEDDGLARHEGFNESFQTRLKEWVVQGSPIRADAGAE